MKEFAKLCLNQSNKDEGICRTMSEPVKQNLIMSGFVPEYEKSKWPPIKHLVFLGCYIDNDKSVINIPNDRLQKVLKTIDDIEFTLPNTVKCILD